MDRKQIALALAVGALALGLWLFRLWQPERQVRLHQRDFLKAVERRNWRTVERMMAVDYEDAWGHDRAFVLEACPRVFGQFLFLTVEQRIDECVVEDGRGTARVMVKLAGNGGPIAQVAISTVNALRAPFVFTWEKRSPWPWDWELKRVENAELDLERIGM